MTYAMASATGIPEVQPVRRNARAEEDEPLLGRAGDLTQKEDEYLLKNLSTGTAAIAQAGILILFALVWAAVFSNKLIFFSPHPLLNSTGVLLTTQAILLLQPTRTPVQKERGGLAHFGLVAVANLTFVAAFVFIELNKASHPETRFQSPHAILGLITYIVILLQAAVGTTMFFFPALVYGSVDTAKKVYRYHRLSGYVLLLLQLATIAAATQTDYNASVLRIKLWAVLVASVLVVAGVGARIKKRKLRLW